MPPIAGVPLSALFVPLFLNRPLKSEIRYNGAMSLFKWSNAHSVYLPEIDAEHRTLYRLGDELHKAVLAGADAARLQPLPGLHLRRLGQARAAEVHRVRQPLHGGEMAKGGRLMAVSEPGVQAQGGGPRHGRSRRGLTAASLH